MYRARIIAFLAKEIESLSQNVFAQRVYSMISMKFNVRPALFAALPASTDLITV